MMNNRCFTFWQAAGLQIGGRRPFGLACVVAAIAILVGCATVRTAPAREPESTSRQEAAMAMFAQRCKKAGEFIHRKVEAVDGIFVLKIRPEGVSHEDQFALTDPYGLDFTGNAYIHAFLRGHFRYSITVSGNGNRVASFVPEGYEFVEAVDPVDGIRYRYVGRVDEPWQYDKSFLKGYIRFVADRAPAVGAPPRYGISFEDISTREEREHWIAGSSLKIVDLNTNEVIAERIGYAVDHFQGSRAGNRAPWLWALDNACPSLSPHGNQVSGAFSGALYRAARFAEKVLKPKVR